MSHFNKTKLLSDKENLHLRKKELVDDICRFILSHPNTEPLWVTGDGVKLEISLNLRVSPIHNEIEYERICVYRGEEIILEDVTDTYPLPLNIANFEVIHDLYLFLCEMEEEEE